MKDPGDYGGLNPILADISIALFGEDFADCYVALTLIAEAHEQGPQGRLAAGIAVQELTDAAMASQAQREVSE